MNNNGNIPTLGRSLRLPVTTPIGAGQEQKQSIQQHWNTIDKVEQEITSKGLVDYTKPNYECPVLTAETLTTPDSKHYTETYVHILAWFNYANELLAQVKARVIQYENMLSIIEAQTRRAARERAESGTKKLTAEEVKDLLTLNPEHQDILHNLQKYQQAKIVLEAKVESIERSLRVISRQVEIRRLDAEQSRTSHNMPGRNFRNPFSQGG